MEYFVTQCDQCKKQIVDASPKGWINIKKADFFGRRWKRIEKSNFCSFTCFQDFCIGSKMHDEEVRAEEAQAV